MASSSDERIALVYRAYQAAFTARASDLQQAQTAEQAQAVMDNCDALERTYLDVANQTLSATGPDVETAYQSAKAATDAVERAYAQGQALTAKINAVAGAVTAISALATKAAALA
jgi:hypothetical protein